MDVSDLPIYILFAKVARDFAESRAVAKTEFAAEDESVDDVFSHVNESVHCVSSPQVLKIEELVTGSGAS